MPCMHITSSGMFFFPRSCLLIFSIITLLIVKSTHSSNNDDDADDTVQVSYEEKQYDDIRTHPNYHLLPDEDTCGNSASDRIIGGQEASLGQFPWLGRLGYAMAGCKKYGVEVAPPTFKCGGSLISERYVVTAAHCVANLPMSECTGTKIKESLQLVIVRLGEYDGKTDIDCDQDFCADPIQDYNVEHIVSHLFYNMPKLKYDITLVRLDRPVVMTEWISPICMPRDSLLTRNLTGLQAQVAGWGISNITSRTASKVLKYVNVPVVENSVCEELYHKYATITAVELCAGGKSKEDSCGGDSGGPLMQVHSVDGAPPRYYHIGVVSFGARQCGTDNEPAVYSRTTAFLTWILNNMKS